MPEWLHNRAEHILAKNPDMPKSQAFAVATQQSHALGKTPKGYGTTAGKREAKQKFDTPKDDKKTANPGHLESAKMAAMFDELQKEAAVHAKHKEYFSKLRCEANRLDAVVGSGKGSDADKARHRAVVEKMRILREGHEKPPPWVTDFAAHAPESSSRVPPRGSSGPRPRTWPSGASHAWGDSAEHQATHAAHFAKRMRRTAAGLGIAAASVPATFAAATLLHGYNARQRRQESEAFKRKHAEAKEPKPKKLNLNKKYVGPRTAGMLAGTALGFGAGGLLGHTIHPDIWHVGALTGATFGMPVGAEAGEAIAHRFKKHAAKFGSGSLLDQVGKPKERALTVAPPNPVFKVKQSFAESQYSGGLGPNKLEHYESGIPPFRVAPLRKVSATSTEEEKKTAAMVDEFMKLNAMSITPESKLHQTQSVGAPKASPAPGPSIAQMAKPVGFGMPLAGATKV